MKKLEVSTWIAVSKGCSIAPSKCLWWADLGDTYMYFWQCRSQGRSSSGLHSSMTQVQSLLAAKMEYPTHLYSSMNHFGALSVF